MAWYNLTSIDAANALTFTQGINSTFMFDLLGNVMLVVIFIIAYQSFTLYLDDPKVNIVASSFGVSIISFGFSYINLVPPSTPFFCLGLFAVSLAVLVFSK